MAKPIEKYTAMVVQPEVTVAEDRDGIKVNLDRALKMIDFGVGYFWEIPARLVVLPEYFLQGVTTPGKGEHGIESFMKKAITIPGPEMDELGKKAQEYGLYIAGGGVVEQLPEFPDRWFNSAFIIGPNGDVVLRYHKWHVPASIGLGTSPLTRRTLVLRVRFDDEGLEWVEITPAYVGDGHVPTLTGGAKRIYRRGLEAN